VDDLLDVTRISVGKIQLHRTRIAAREVVRRAAEDHRATFLQREIELRVEASDPAWIDADETRIAQVVGNLLQNAAKFSRAGGTVTLGVGSADGVVRIRVRDEGVGIALELLPHVFEPFVQAAHGAAQSEGGLGLGLALVKGLVELHGGSVSAHSEGPGRGSDFLVTLPLASAGVEAEPALPATALRPLVILHIEDNRDVAESIAEVLRMDGHQVHVARDGRSGVAKAREVKPDLVLCDIGLPDMDGYQIARTLRADETVRSAMLVALSGYAQPEDRRRAAEAGFDAHLKKPVPLDALEALLRDAAARGARGG
jgi:two-component system CheB/CheR fusion protein